VSNFRRLLILGGIIGLVAALILALTSTHSTYADDCGSALAPKSLPGSDVNGPDLGFGQIMTKNACADAVSKRRGEAIPLAVLALLLLVGGVLDWSRFGPRTEPAGGPEAGPSVPPPPAS